MWEIRMTKLYVTSEAAITAFLVLVGAFSATPVNAADTKTAAGPTGFATESDDWIAPPGSSISINRTNGRISVALPTQPIDGSAEQLARFDEWRSHPYAGDGAFPSTREEPANFPKHTLYYPADLTKAPKLPVVLWANGGCRTTSVEFTRFLGEIASHGYVIAAIGRGDNPFQIIRIGAPTGTGEQSADARPRQDMDPSNMLAALDLLAKENERKASRFYHRIDLSAVAAMGQSCGGFMAFEAAKDVRIKAVAALNSNFPTRSGPTPMPLRNAVPNWNSEDLKIPAAFFTGGPADLAYSYAVKSYEAVPGAAPTVRVDMPAMGHTGAYPMPDVRWTRAVIQWLNWNLKGDQTAKAIFAGAGCGLCGDSDFWVSTKGID
jgi:dienelactone hydrolase